MHYLHPSSPSCCKSELDLFSVNPTQTSINESNFISVAPINAFSDTDVPLEFNIPGSSDHYLDPANIYLYLKIKLTKNDGTVLNDTEYTVFPETNFLYTAFNQIEVFLNETSLGASAANYPYRSYIDNLLNFSDDAKQSHLQSVGFYKLNNYETVAKKFEKLNNKTFDVYGRIMSDIFMQERLLLPSVDMRVRLNRAASPFALRIMGVPSNDETPPSPIFQIQEAFLYVRKVKLSPQKHLEIEKTLLSDTAKYPIKRVETKLFNYTRGLSTISIPNVIIGNLPQKVIVGIVSHEAYSGSYKKSPFKFEPFKLKELVLLVNGQPYGRPYETIYDGENSLCNRAYYSLFSNTTACSDVGTGIDPDSYINDTNLYSFDLTPDQTGNNASHLNIIKQGTLGLKFNFDTAVDTPITIMVYMETPQVIEIDRTRNIITSF